MTTATWIGLAVFAVGTYALRFGGVHLMRRTGDDGAGRSRVLTAAVGALLAAVAVGTAVVDDHGSTGVDRLAGVVVGGLCAIRGTPLVVTLIAAATTTALIRLGVGL